MLPVYRAAQVALKKRRRYLDASTISVRKIGIEATKDGTRRMGLSLLRKEPERHYDRPERAAGYGEGVPHGSSGVAGGGTDGAVFAGQPRSRHPEYRFGSGAHRPIP